MPTPSATDEVLAPNWGRRLLRWVLTLVVVALVVVFAGGTLRDGWTQLVASKPKILWGWVALSAVLYVGGLAPMALFWWRVLAALGQHPGFGKLVRAYYLGHLGKYAPGKALVAVLRTGTLARAGCAWRPVVVSVFVETLTMMATGSAIAAGLLAGTADASTLHISLAAALAVLAGLPVLPPVARFLARRVIPHAPTGDGAPPIVERLTWALALEGLACATATWVVLAFSLWAAVQAAGSETIPPLASLPVWIEAVTLPMVAGFVSLLPGGVFVRDALQVEMLTPTVPADLALLGVLLWRMISVGSEAFVCGTIEVYRLVRSTRSHGNPQL